MESYESSDDDCYEVDLLPAPPTEKKQETGYPSQRLVKTVCLVLLWVSFGFLTSVGGTTVVDFTEILHESYTHIGMALGVHFLGILCGLFLSGFLSDHLRLDRHMLLGCSAIAMGILNLVKPFSFHVIMYAVVLGVEGLFKGIIKPVANNLLLSLWGEAAPTPVNIFHFGFGVGALIGPFVTKPFLSERCPSLATNSTRVTLNPVCKSTADDDGIKYIRESRIGIPFTISVVPIVAMGVMFLVFYTRNRVSSIRKGSAVVTSQTPHGDPGTRLGIWGILIVVLLLCYYFTLAGSGFGGYLFTIAFESDLGCSKDDASKIASTFYAAFTSGRVLAAVFLQWFSIKTLFIFYVFGAFGSMLGMAVFGLFSKTSLWLFSAICALYAGPLWPAGLAWTNNYMHLTTMNIAVAETGACVGEIIFFWVGGYLIDTRNIPAIFTMTLTCNAAACLVTVILYLIAYRIGKRNFQERNLNDLELKWIPVAK
ncbi:sodium-dependent glucose transporter 1C-like [Liolophura sinensis]|uniref:sodium-dependent glucose transporter 1C-like n=1 Tax=Liolophura sinensis TaxID=3198878 RepID=UPI003158E9F8